LGLRDKTIGALNLFGRTQIPMSREHIIVARAFADLAAMSILQYRATADTCLLNEQLTQALNSRIVIEQAKGKIAERMKVDLEEAFARLRRHARRNSISLTAVAHAAIENTIDSPAWIPPQDADGNSDSASRRPGVD
jgi:hypothetical protein